MLASPDQQISLTDPDSRSMATSGRGSGVVGYNVQVAVDTEHHLIVTHEVTNSGSDRSQLANIAVQAKDVLGAEHLDAVADRGYFNSPEILACEQANITVTLPKPMTSGAKADGRFGKQDFAYLPTDDVHRCPAGEKMTYRYTNQENGRTLRHYWTGACRHCPLKAQCAKEPVRRIKRWEHEHVLTRGSLLGGKTQAASRCQSAGDAPASRDGRASFRHAENADGRHPLSDEAPTEGRHRNPLAQLSRQQLCRETGGLRASERAGLCLSTWTAA